MLRITLLELFAIALMLLSVYLATRESLWTWPAAMASAALLAVFFFRARVYADAAAYAASVGVSVYGLRHWFRARRERGRLDISLTPPDVKFFLFGVFATGSTALGWVLYRFTQSSSPWVHGPAIVLALLAQWMLAGNFSATGSSGGPSIAFRRWLPVAATC
jgi:nicotinamide mononucleotide transporter